MCNFCLSELNFRVVSNGSRGISAFGWQWREVPVFETSLISMGIPAGVQLQMRVESEDGWMQEWQTSEK